MPITLAIGVFVLVALAAIKVNGAGKKRQTFTAFGVSLLYRHARWCWCVAYAADQAVVHFRRQRASLSIETECSEVEK